MSRSQPWFLGRKIIQVAFTYENVSIGFEDQTGVTIYTPCSIVEGFQPSLYIGARVTAELWSSDQFYIELDNGNRISVDLTDDAWTGPEAMVFAYENSGTMVVTEPPEEISVFREELDK
jgi:hypothetical protein